MEQVKWHSCGKRHCLGWGRHSTCIYGLIGGGNTEMVELAPYNKCRQDLKERKTKDCYQVAVVVAGNEVVVG